MRVSRVIKATSRQRCMLMRRRVILMVSFATALVPLLRVQHQVVPTSVRVVGSLKVSSSLSCLVQLRLNLHGTIMRFSVHYTA